MKLDFCVSHNYTQRDLLLLHHRRPPPSPLPPPPSSSPAATAALLPLYMYIHCFSELRRIILK